MDKRVKAVLDLFEPRMELSFADLLLALRELEGARVHKLEGQDTALVMLPGARTARVWDNGGEVGVEIVDSGSIPDMFPLRTSAGFIDPWEVVLAVHDSIDRQTRGEPGRGGDAPFPVPLLRVARVMGIEIPPELDAMEEDA